MRADILFPGVVPCGIIQGERSCQRAVFMRGWYDAYMAAIEKNHKYRLVLFDAHAIIHRAYHALPDFTTKTGEPTGGLYGLASMILKAINEFHPDYMAACYDLPGPTFRHKEYKEYKAGRAKIDDALVLQLQSSRKIFEALGIPIYDKPGFEADDMLGTIVATMKQNKDVEIIIVSGDMDTLQLVDGKKVRVYTLRKGLNDTIVYDEEKVRERFGFGPELLPDYKGLRGDPSDNIIGVPGIGEKIATELITRWGGIEDIYKALKKGKDAFVKAGTKARTADILAANEDEAKFSKVLATIRRDAPIEYVLPKTTWEEGFAIAPALKVFEELEFKTLAARLKTILRSRDEKGEGREEKPRAPSPESSAKNTEEPEAREFKRAQIALSLLDSELANPTLEDMLLRTGKEDFVSARDALARELKETGMTRVEEEIELPLLPIIARMEARGIALDTVYLKKLSLNYHKKLSKFESAIYEHAGEVFNINSPQQLGKILFDTLNLTTKGLKKTAGGARSTRESELIKMRELHPIIDAILEYRELQKLLSTYIDNLPHMLGPDGRLHTTFHQIGAATGRMSSSNPGLQNIPVRDGYGAAIRDGFVAGKGKTLLALDYSQIELRMLAMLSGDPGLADIFIKGEDIHAAVAMRVFRVPKEKLDHEMRRRAKVINFGIIYGMGITALQGALGSTRAEAQEFYDQYFITFPKIAAYFDQVKKDAAKKGYTETLFGRRRYFRDITSRIPYLRAAAERMAMNAPLQGTAADFVKKAMIACDAVLKKEGLAHLAVLLLQVHDELIFEVENDAATVAKAEKVIKAAMEGVNKGTPGEHIPLVVSVAKGERWGSLK